MLAKLAQRLGRGGGPAAVAFWAMTSTARFIPMVKTSSNIWQVGIDRAMLHIGSEASNPGLDQHPVRRMRPDRTGQFSSIRARSSVTLSGDQPLGRLARGGFGLSSVASPRCT